MFSRREKVLLVLAAITVAAVVALQFMAGGAEGTPAQRQGESLRALRRRVADSEARVGKVTAAETELTAVMLRAAQASAAAAQVNIVSVRPRRAAKLSSGAVEHSLEVQASGHFPAIAKFMFEIEAKHRELRIARVAISSGDSGSDKVTCAIVIAGYSPGEIAK